MRQRFIEAKSVAVSSRYPSLTRLFFPHDIPKRLNATIKGGWGRRIRNQGKRAGQVERKQMMYKGWTFCTRPCGKRACTRRTERNGAIRTLHDEREKEADSEIKGEGEKENNAREAYHGVIALSSINHVTYAPCSSMYSV